MIRETNAASRTSCKASSAGMHSPPLSRAPGGGRAGDRAPSSGAFEARRLAADAVVARLGGKQTGRTADVRERDQARTDPRVGDPRVRANPSGFEWVTRDVTPEDLEGLTDGQAGTDHRRAAATGDDPPASAGRDDQTCGRWCCRSRQRSQCSGEGVEWQGRRQQVAMPRGEPSPRTVGATTPHTHGA